MYASCASPLRRTAGALLGMPRAFAGSPRFRSSCWRGPRRGRSYAVCAICFCYDVIRQGSPVFALLITAAAGASPAPTRRSPHPPRSRRRRRPRRRRCGGCSQTRAPAEPRRDDARRNRSRRARLEEAVDQLVKERNAPGRTLGGWAESYTRGSRRPLLPIGSGFDGSRRSRHTPRADSATLARDLELENSSDAVGSQSASGMEELRTRRVRWRSSNKRLPKRATPCSPSRIAGSHSSAPFGGSAGSRKTQLFTVPDGSGGCRRN